MEFTQIYVKLTTQITREINGNARIFHHHLITSSFSIPKWLKNWKSIWRQVTLLIVANAAKIRKWEKRESSILSLHVLSPLRNIHERKDDDLTIFSSHLSLRLRMTLVKMQVFFVSLSRFFFLRNHSNESKWAMPLFDSWIWIPCEFARFPTM